MTSHQSDQKLTRRSTIAAVTGAGLGMALTIPRGAAAQGDGLASHPMVGTWLVRPPDGSLGINYIRADGTWMYSGGPITSGPDGTIQYQSDQHGVWEPDPENDLGIHFVSVQALYDETNTYVGTVIIDGYPSVSDDGQSLGDDWSRSFFTVRDANDEVIEVVRGDATTPPIVGVRLTAGELVMPPLNATAATPEL